VKGTKSIFHRCGFATVASLRFCPAKLAHTVSHLNAGSLVSAADFHPSGGKLAAPSLLKLRRGVSAKAYILLPPGGKIQPTKPDNHPLAHAVGTPP
jgi:hypothetical protein